MARTAQLLQERTLLVILILLFIGGAGFFWQLSNLSTQLVRTMALQNAGVVSRALTEFRTLYTSEVVDRVLPHGIEATHDYADRPKAIPLPATLSVLLGNRIGEAPGSKGDVRLYSAYPFPWRKDGGAKDDFERQALAALDRDPEQPFVRFEQFGGGPSLRYATADRMRAQCVNCHNTHPSSPKKDWKAGDVRGVLEVAVSLEAAVGEIRSGLLRTSVLFGSGGVLLIAFLAFALGRIRLANDTLKASERKFRLVAETAYDAIVSADASGTIRYFNHAAERMFGYGAGELLDQPLTLLMPERYQDAHRGGLERYLRTGEARVIGKTVTLAGRRKDGSEFPLELSLAVWRVEGAPSFSGILRDISDRELTKQVLQANRELETALRQLKETQAQLVLNARLASLGGMVAGIAHEINTPVGVGVTAASALNDLAIKFKREHESGSLKRSDLDRFVAMAGESTAMILRNLQRAVSLVESFKQVAVDQSSDESRRFPLKGYLNEVLLNLEPQLKKTTHQVEVDCPDTLVVDIHPGAIAQIVTNLVNNSLIHGFERRHDFDRRENGHIRIAATQHGDWVTLRYSDDGRGIPPEHLARVFDPFFTTKRGAGGSGLGMHIVYNLVTQRLGGTVDLTSKPGDGVQIVIRFPAQAAKSTA